MKSYPLLFILTLLLCACNKYELKISQDPAFNLSQLRTFSIIPDPRGVERINGNSTDISPQEILETSKSTLFEKGYQEVKPHRDPDFFLALHFAETRPMSAVEINSYYRSPWGPSNSYLENMPNENGAVETWPKDTLVADIISQKERLLIWRGSIKLEPGKVTDEENAKKELEDRLAALFGQLPNVIR